MKFLFAAGLAAGLAISIAGAANASSVALTGFSGGTEATSGGDQLYGWFFDTSSAIDITALGVGDASGGPLQVSHDVGIFDVSDQSLLVSTNVPAGSGASLLDGFMYESISSFHLAAGSYVIVMTMPADNADLQSISNTSVTTASPITYVDSAFGVGSSLAFPTTAGVFSKGLFGPNFQFDASAAAPEPASWTLMIAGFGLAGAALRRRRAVAT